MHDSVLDTLPRCLELSKTAAGRQQLLETNELDKLCSCTARLMPPWQKTLEDSVMDSNQTEQLLLLLRSLRNSCAAGFVAADILHRHNLHHAAAQLAVLLARRQSIEHTLPEAEQQSKTQQQPGCQQAQLQGSLLLTAVQLLANMSNTHSAAVWEAVFPTRLSSIACCRQESVHEAAALMILSCLRGSCQVLTDILSPAASSIWLQLLAPLMPTAAANSGISSSGSSTHSHIIAEGRTAVQAGSGSHDNLCLLVKAVALQHGRLQQLLENLQLDDSIEHGSDSNTDSGAQTTSAAHLRVNMAHAVLLHLVASEAATVPAAHIEDVEAQQEQYLQSEQCLPWLRYLVGLLRTLWLTTKCSDSRGHGTVAAFALEATLQVLLAVVSRDDQGRALVMLAADGSAATSSNCVDQLYTLGLVHLLLDMLKQLGPPPKRQKQDPSTGQQERQDASLGTAAQQHQQQAYAGYRADLIAVLSNFLCGDKSMQVDVMAAGGVEVLLNNCNLDDTAPLAREWALWSIRNMCQGNEDVQRYIAQFQAVEAVQSEELERMGMELQLDNMTNKLKLVKKPGQQHEAG